MDAIASETYEALHATWRLLGTRNPMLEHGPWLAVAVGPDAGTNHGLLTAPGGTAEIPDVASFFTGHGRPYTLEVPEGMDPAVDDELLAAGYQAIGLVPMMRLDPAGLAPRSSDGLRILRVSMDDGLRALVETAAAGFAMPIQSAEAFTPPWLVEREGVTYFLGTLEDRPVGTAVAMRGDDAVGIFMVATVEDARGRGVGAALTTHAVRSGFDAGARFAFLQSSVLGYGVYKRLGFRTVWRSAWYARAG